jgi:toxin ParE1/3/4
VIQVEFSPQSLRDLQEIGDRIALDRPIRAETFVNELIDTAEAIGYQPHAYPPRSDLSPGLREAIHKPYLVLFRVTDNHVEIVRIVHGARGLKNLSFK